jgi:hypothetical protein
MPDANCFVGEFLTRGAEFGKFGSRGRALMSHHSAGCDIMAENVSTMVQNC